MFLHTVWGIRMGNYNNLTRTVWLEIDFEKDLNEQKSANP